MGPSAAGGAGCDDHGRDRHGRAGPEHALDGVDELVVARVHGDVEGAGGQVERTDGVAPEDVGVAHGHVVLEVLLPVLDGRQQAVAAAFDEEAGELDPARFVEGATEHKGSWWPDWLDWLKAQAPETVKAEGARVPGKGKLKAIEDAPGRYVREK